MSRPPPTASSPDASTRTAGGVRAPADPLTATGASLSSTEAGTGGMRSRPGTGAPSPSPGWALPATTPVRLPGPITSAGSCRFPSLPRQDQGGGVMAGSRSNRCRMRHRGRIRAERHRHRRRTPRTTGNHRPPLRSGRRARQPPRSTRSPSRPQDTSATDTVRSPRPQRTAGTCPTAADPANRPGHDHEQLRLPSSSGRSGIRVPGGRGTGRRRGTACRGGGVLRLLPHRRRRLRPRELHPRPAQRRPAHVLHHDPAFRTTLTEHGGSPLGGTAGEPAAVELQDIADPTVHAAVRRALETPAALLEAGRQTVPFHGRQDLLTDLEPWLRVERAQGVAAARPRRARAGPPRPQPRPPAQHHRWTVLRPRAQRPPRATAGGPAGGQAAVGRPRLRRDPPQPDGRPRRGRHRASREQPCQAPADPHRRPRVPARKHPHPRLSPRTPGPPPCTDRARAAAHGRPWRGVPAGYGPR